MSIIATESIYLAFFTAENTGTVLDWHQRYAIAIGTAKGLRFLHEECRGGPIIHRDMRPSNILLTHDFVPMVKYSLNNFEIYYMSPPTSNTKDSWLSSKENIIEKVHVH